MKYFYLFVLLLSVIPNKAIADNLPVNHLVWRGKVYNLDYLWGKGVKPVVEQKTAEPVSQVESREVRDNKQRVNFENARGLALIEGLRNMR